MPPKKDGGARRARSPVTETPTAAGPVPTPPAAGFDDPAVAEGAAIVAAIPARVAAGAATPAHWQCSASNVLLLRVAAAAGAVPSGPVKIAAFDMDDTIVTPDGTHLFAKSAKDWKWLHPSVPAKLKSLAAEGFELLIISNQGGSDGDGDVKSDHLKQKIIDLGAQLGVPLCAMLALEKENPMRKPTSAMWRMWASIHHHERKLSGPVSVPAVIDVDASFYVGDAAGRKIMTMAGRKKDFSCGDRKFAYNSGLKFYTPEEFYLGQAPAAHDWEGFGPDEVAALRKNMAPADNFRVPAASPEMILMVGFPGSGKSSFYRNILAPHGYVHVNRDTLKTIDKCAAAAEAALKAGKSVCVDNTNPSADDRKKFIDIARKCGVPARAFIMSAGFELSMHLNRLRATLGIAPVVSSVAYRMMQGKLRERATLEEGLTEVVDAPVIPSFAGLPPLAEKLFFEL
jgi:bifunctional polynucleotide phosphatase/kinase